MSQSLFGHGSVWWGQQPARARGSGAKGRTGRARRCSAQRTLSGTRARPRGPQPACREEGEGSAPVLGAAQRIKLGEGGGERGRGGGEDARILQCDVERQTLVRSIDLGGRKLPVLRVDGRAGDNRRLLMVEREGQLREGEGQPACARGERAASAAGSARASRCSGGTNGWGRPACGQTRSMVSKGQQGSLERRSDPPPEKLSSSTASPPSAGVLALQTGRAPVSESPRSRGRRDRRTRARASRAALAGGPCSRARGSGSSRC